MACPSPGLWLVSSAACADAEGNFKLNRLRRVGVPGPVSRYSSGLPSPHRDTVSPIKWPCANTTTSCIRPQCASSWPSMYHSRQPYDLKLIGIVCTNIDGYVFEVRHVHSHASPISTLYQPARARSRYLPISRIFLLTYPSGSSPALSSRRKNTGVK